MGVYHNFVYGTIYIITKYMGVSLYGMSIDIWDYLCYNGYCQKGKAHEQGRGYDGMAKGRKKSRRKRKPTAAPKRMTAFLDSILAGIISGLIVAALVKLFNW